MFNVPTDIKNKILEYYGKGEEISIELVVLVGLNTKSAKEKVENLGGEYEDLGYGFGIVKVPTSKLEEVAKIPEIQYLELPKTLYTSYLPSNKSSCIPEVWELYKLTGKGVLVGFIDSGIDFTHPAFKDEMGNTRIEYIYDVGQNKVWNRSTINNALKSDNPYGIITSIDEVGHGTHVAGIACAGGKINQKYYGAAYESSIAMVKMTRVGELNFAQSTQLMRGIKFLIDKSKEIGMPLVINLSYSTNDGAHDGNSLLELYISTINSLEKISFVCAAGNEGDRGHHVGGGLKERQTIDFNIGGAEKTLVLQLYKNFTNDIRIKIRNPSGINTEIIPLNKRYITGGVGDDEYFIYNNGPTPFNINGEIVISFISRESYISSGQWSITLFVEELERGQYDIWMPISEGLNPQTKFLSPNPYNTLGIPATVENAISVGSYDSDTNTFSAFSGRGKRGGQPIKPDLTAPGENIESSSPGGGYDALSGTSMAAPIVAGTVALLMQWGIIQGNDLYMYGERVKYFLLRGAKKTRSDVSYPNPMWGYGTLCGNKALEFAKKEKLRFRFNNKNHGERIKDRMNECGDLFKLDNYESYIIEYYGDIEGKISDISYACVLILDEHKAVISVELGRLKELMKSVPEILYVEQCALYTLNALSPIDTANISKFHENQFLTLRGQGVVVGIIDTGIDYLNEEFTYEDDTTRILSLWDQTNNLGSAPEITGFGTEFNETDINEAISLKFQDKDPYTVVNSRDEIGHGTSIAGIVGARGKGEVTGAAPDCEFIIVKLRQAKKSLLEKEGINNNGVPMYSGVDVVLGIKYVFDKLKRLNKPGVILISSGTNRGGHDGNSLVERYIDEISKVRGLAVVTGTGNEGDSSTHTSGKFAKAGEVKTIELKVDKAQKNLTFEVWCRKPDKISIGLVSPSGEVVDKIPAKLMEVEEIKLVFEGSSIFVKYFIPEEVSGDELIRIDIRNAKGGVWQIQLFGDLIVDGRFDIWLNQKALLKEETRFLNPDPFITSTIPATSKQIIVCGTYDQNTDGILAYSGRGYTRDNRVTPDVATGGVNVETTSVGGGTTILNGSSAASAVLAGAVALLLQWGIVEGNDKTLYSTKLTTYLIRGARKRQGDIYPNEQWGYGILDLNGVFENIRMIDSRSSDRIVVNIPKEVYRRLKF